VAKTYFQYTFFILLVFLFASSCGVENEPNYVLTTQAVPAEAGTVIQSSISNEDGKAIRVTATANEHWEFVGWAGDLKNTNESTVFVFMDQNREVQALFEKVDYPVTIHVEGEGNVRTEVVSQKTTTEEFQHATVLRLVAEPEPGWKISEWSGDASGTENEVEVEVDGPVEVTATFERIDYELTINIEGEGEVTQEFVLPKTTTSEYPFETMVQLTAIADEGWELEQWSGDASGSEQSVMIEMDGDKEVNVKFEPKLFSVDIQINGSGTFVTSVLFSPVANASSGNQFAFGSVVKIQALPGSGWSFAGWSGDRESTSSSIEIVIDADKNLVLDFLPFAPNSRILQLGDSITNGAPYSYRFGLHNMLIDNALKFQNIGTQFRFTEGSSGQWDANHEGHDGAKTDFIESNLPVWLQTYTADIVLIHLGTNDVTTLAQSGGVPGQLTSGLNNVTSMINHLRNDNPNVKIYLALILPIDVPSLDRDTVNNMVSVWNSNLQSIANNNTTAASPIKIVDMNSGFNRFDLIDGIHPTQATAFEMARRWFNAIISL
tara:strand:+ start:1603 stop:3246 length:1644 start_codon:yes stop_codon:yes gene_type:complete